MWRRQRISGVSWPANGGGNIGGSMASAKAK